MILIHQKICGQSTGGAIAQLPLNYATVHVKHGRECIELKAEYSVYLYINAIGIQRITKILMSHCNGLNHFTLKLKLPRVDA